VSICYLAFPTNMPRHTIYHAKSHQYHLQHEGCTYVLTSTLKSTQPIIDHTTVNQVSLNQCVSLCLVHPINLDNWNNLVPPAMDPPLQEFADVFTQPPELPLSHSIELTLDLIPSASLPDALSYHITPSEAIEMEHPIGQLLNLGHIPPSSSPRASSAFAIPNKDDSRGCLVTPYRALNKANVKTRYPLPQIEELLDHSQGDYSFTQMDLIVGYH
jgi:hypothetical protein